MTSEEGHLESFFLNLKCSDVTLCVTLIDERCLRIPSHRFVLASRSPVFEKMFEKDKFIEGKTGVANITIPGGEQVALAFIRFFYYGNVQIVGLEGSVALLKASHLYEVERLTRISEDIILDAITPYNACEIYEETKGLMSPEYSEVILSLILRSAFVIFQKLYHLSLSEEAMVTILKSDFLNVLSETQAADALWSWGKWKSLINKSSSSVDDITQRIQDMVKHLRWGLLDDGKLYLSLDESKWDHLAPANSQNERRTERKPKRKPSLIKFSREFDLNNFAESHYYKDWSRKEIENVLLSFSCDRNLTLIAFELDLTIECSIEAKIAENMELKLNESILSLSNAKKYIIQLERKDQLAFQSYRFLLELEKPAILEKTNHHEITLKLLLGSANKVLIPRYEVRSILNFPKNEHMSNVNFIMQQKALSVLKLYCFL